MEESPITTTVLMCHAPIVVPGIASELRAEASAASTRAMREAARAVVDTRPDAVLIVSPHAPRDQRGFLVAIDPETAGDFGRFGAPEVGAVLPGSPQRAARIAQAAERLGVPVGTATLGPLDHGTLVPLWFIAEAGWTGPTIRFALPMFTEHHVCETMGRAVAEAARVSGERWAFVASGDMSHRLKPDAPAGFSPKASNFDREVVAAVDAGDVAAVRRIDPALRELAAEDVVDSLDVALGVMGSGAHPHRTLSYEGPYGVGYLIAVLDEGRSARQ
jgi:aromatic ring-opening dioxygenase LigB subunit